jgi:hypothetical protein
MHTSMHLFTAIAVYADWASLEFFPNDLQVHAAMHRTDTPNTWKRLDKGVFEAFLSRS